MEVKPGRATLDIRYEPASFAWGLRLAVVGLAVNAGWFAAVFGGRPAASVSSAAGLARPNSARH